MEHTNGLEEVIRNFINKKVGHFALEDDQGIIHVNAVLIADLYWLEECEKGLEIAEKQTTSNNLEEENENRKQHNRTK